MPTKTPSKTKAAAKKTAAPKKTAAKKPATAKTTASKRAAAKKTTAARKPTVKTATAARKTAANKPAATKKAATKKAAAKKTTAARKPTVKAAATKKTTAAAKKPAATKKTAAAKKTTAARKPTVKAATATKKTTAAAKKPAATKKAAAKAVAVAPQVEETVVVGAEPALEPSVLTLTPALEKMLAKGKKDGTLDSDDVTKATAKELPADQVDAFYDLLQAEGVVLTGDEEEDEEEAEAINEVEITKMDADPQKQDSIRLYLNEITKTPLLTKDQEVKLAKQKDFYVPYMLTDEEAKGLSTDARDMAIWEKIKDLPLSERMEVVEGKKAYDHIIKANLRLVVSIARKYHRSDGLPMLDLIQEGNIGLMRAVTKFDWARGFKLSTYATWWIRQSITRAISEQVRTIRIPVHVYEELSKFKKTRSQLESKNGREPTREELAIYLGYVQDYEDKGEKDPLAKAVARIEELEQYAQDTVSLHTKVGDGEGSELGDFVADDESMQPELVAVQGSLEEELNRALAGLSLRQRQVISLRLGLGVETPRTLEAIASKLGLTREKVRGIEQEVLAHLEKNAALKDSSA